MNHKFNLLPLLFLFSTYLQSTDMYIKRIENKSKYNAFLVIVKKIITKNEIYIVDQNPLKRDDKALEIQCKVDSDESLYLEIEVGDEIRYYPITNFYIYTLEILPAHINPSINGVLEKPYIRYKINDSNKTQYRPIEPTFRFNKNVLKRILLRENVNSNLQPTSPYMDENNNNDKNLTVTLINNSSYPCTLNVGTLQEFCLLVSCESNQREDKEFILKNCPSTYFLKILLDSSFLYYELPKISLDILRIKISANKKVVCQEKSKFEFKKDIIFQEKEIKGTEIQNHSINNAASREISFITNQYQDEAYVAYESKNQLECVRQYDKELVKSLPFKF